MGLTTLQLRTIGALALLLATVDQTVEAAPRESARVKHILVFGDSLSDGYQLSRSQAYPALLVNYLRAAGLDYEVLNASASGGTTAGGLERLGKHLGRRIDIFILELGINDAFLGVPVPQIRDNLQTIIDRVKAKNPKARIVIVGMQLPNLSSDNFVRAYGEMYADLAAKNKAAFVPYLLDGVAGDPELNLSRSNPSERSRAQNPGRECLAHFGTRRPGNGHALMSSRPQNSLISGLELNGKLVVLPIRIRLRPA